MATAGCGATAREYCKLQETGVFPDLLWIRRVLVRSQEGQLASTQGPTTRCVLSGSFVFSEGWQFRSQFAALTAVLKSSCNLFVSLVTLSTSA
jgi:hypothetical protein